MKSNFAHYFHAYKEFYLISFDVDIDFFKLRFPDSKYPLIMKIGHRVFYLGRAGCLSIREQRLYIILYIHMN